MNFGRRNLFVLFRRTLQKTEYDQLRNVESSYVEDPGSRQGLVTSYNETVLRRVYAPYFRMSWHQRLEILAAHSVARGKRKSILDAQLLGKRRVALYLSGDGLAQATHLGHPEGFHRYQIASRDINILYLCSHNVRTQVMLGDVGSAFGQALNVRIYL